jgi:hypothetical protein
VFVYNEAVSSEDCIACMVSEQNTNMKNGQNGTHMKTIVSLATVGKQKLY